MTDTIKDKIQVSTSRIFMENINLMVQFGIIQQRQAELIQRVLDDCKYGNKVLQYGSLETFFRHDKDMFDKEFLDKLSATTENTK